MKVNDLLDMIGDADDSIIEEAKIIKKSPVPRWTKWLAVVACLSLAVSGTIFLTKNFSSGKDSVGTDYEVEDESSSVSSSADMIAFFIWHGNRYIQYEWIDDSYIVGEYLGTATGKIDEWTPNEEYTEFAGSVKGDFYSVKDYDPSFMLCMKEETGTVTTYICNNDTTLKQGADLFEDRLHLSANYSTVQYESHESWNQTKKELYEVKGNEEIIRNFLEQIDEAEFKYTDRENITDSSIYANERYHVYFKMNNGTTVHLRLSENGYVRFHGLPDLCVQISDDSFKAMIDLLNNKAESKPVYVPDPITQKFQKCKNNPELGVFVPSFEIPKTTLLAADVLYYLESGTGAETGTKAIYVEYTSYSDPQLYYSVTVTWKDEYSQDGWSEPMINYSELSKELLSEYVKTKPSSDVSRIDIGVWYGNVSVVLSGSGIDAEEAYNIFSSIDYNS